MSLQPTQRSTQAASHSFVNAMAGISEQLHACMQCGTCTASCPNSEAMDYTPRHLWRLVQLGAHEELFHCKTFWLCSSCYTCTLRCPRGLPLTEIVASLKRVAIAEGLIQDRRSSCFYTTFCQTVLRYGRLRETELMGRYFLSLKNPVAPFSFAGLGMKLLLKGKLSLQMPYFNRAGKLDEIYRKVLELESLP